MSICVTVYKGVCEFVCVCCCTLGSSCRFEVGSPGAHSDNCTSIIFCSSIVFLYSFFTVPLLLEYLSHCRVLFFPVLALRELNKLKNMTKFGSGRSPRRQCEFIAGCVGIYPCNCTATHRLLQCMSVCMLHIRLCGCALCIMCGFCATFSTLCLFGLFKVPWKCCKKKIEKSDVELNNVAALFRLSVWRDGGRRSRRRIRSHRALWHVCNVTRRFMHSPESCAFRIDRIFSLVHSLHVQ